MKRHASRQMTRISGSRKATMLEYGLTARMKPLYGRPSVAAPAYATAFHSGAATEGRPYRGFKEPPTCEPPRSCEPLLYVSCQIDHTRIFTQPLPVGGFRKRLFNSPFPFPFL